MPRDFSAVIRPANSSCNCRAMTRPSMSSAAIVQNLNLLNSDHRRVSPTLVEPFFTGYDNAEALITAEIEVGGVREQVIDSSMIVRADQFVFGRSLNAEGAADNALALNDAFGRRFIVLDRSCVRGCR